MTPNVCRIFVDMLIGKKLLLIANMESFIGQFVHPVKGEGIKGVDGDKGYFSQLRASIYHNT